jgi:hypothetical protein
MFSFHVQMLMNVAACEYSDTSVNPLSMSCCRHYDTHDGCGCHRRKRRSRLISTLYYKLLGEGEVENVYADSSVGLQYSAFNPQTDKNGVNVAGNDNGFYYLGSFLTVSGQAEEDVQAQESFTFRNARGDTFSAIAQYKESQLSPATQLPAVTFAVTSGLGKYKHARKAIIEYNNDTLLRTVRVYT